MLSEAKLAGKIKKPASWAGFPLAVLAYFW